jgi:NAD(P)-dependent dehydrogenase (short-subunit alcohol dehydrogenase family)
MGHGKTADAAATNVAGRVGGRVALVTGGAAGLGRSHALALAQEGADVVIFDLGDNNRDAEPGYRLSRQAELDDTIEEIEKLGRRSLGIAGDVRNQADLDRAVAATIESFGRLDILVANAGIVVLGNTWMLPHAEWQLSLQTNLTGVWQSCRAALPSMIENRYGRIILIASTAATKGMKGLGAYSACKAGVAAMGRAMAAEVGEYGITVNSICPSTVPAGSGRGIAARHNLDFAVFTEAALDMQAIKSLLEPIDISNAVVFLASDEARYVTGITLPIDGGAMAL